MPSNFNKTRQVRFWMMWRRAGALPKKGTAVTEDILFQNAKIEGIDVSKICVLKERWAQTAPYRAGVKSCLVRCDLIIRSDGSIVALDGCMGLDSLQVLNMHAQTENSQYTMEILKGYFPEVSKLDLPLIDLRQKVVQMLGWEKYTERLTSF